VDERGRRGASCLYPPGLGVGSGFRVQGSGFRVQGSGLWTGGGGRGRAASLRLVWVWGLSLSKRERERESAHVRKVWGAGFVVGG